MVSDFLEIEFLIAVSYLVVKRAKPGHLRTSVVLIAKPPSSTTFLQISLLSLIIDYIKKQ